MLFKKQAETGGTRLSFASPAPVANGTGKQAAAFFCTPDSKSAKPKQKKQTNSTVVIEDKGNTPNAVNQPLTMTAVNGTAKSSLLASELVMTSQRNDAAGKVITAGQTVVLSSSSSSAFSLSSSSSPSTGTVPSTTMTTTTTFTDQPVIVNAKLANCLNILNRWNTVTPSVAYATALSAASSSSSTSSTSSSSAENSRNSGTFFSDTSGGNLSDAADSVAVATSKTTTVRFAPSSNLAESGSSVARKATFVMRPPPSHLLETASSVKQPQLSTKDVKGVAFSNQHSINRSKTFTMEAKPKQFATVKQPSTTAATTTTGVVEYETVEFTPGMTSKVRKY